MARLAAALEQEFPATNRGWGIRMVTLYDSMLDERVRPSLLMLLGAVGMVLLIACANVANLLLARSIARQRELALRTALGAGRSRPVRQLVTESVCLGVVSGTAGLFLAVFAVKILRVMLPPTLPRIDEITIDATVLAAGMVLSIGSGLFMGLVPAMRASRVALVPALVQQGRGLAGSSKRLLRQGLVLGQMALATMLLVGAALLLQSFVRLQHVRLGFEPDGVIAGRIALPRARYPDAMRTADFYRRLLESLTGVSQFESVAFATSAPFAPGVRASGRSRDASGAPDVWVGAVEHIVSPDYFATLRIPLLAGRAFAPQDGSHSTPVAVISENLARQLWPGRNPVGQTLDWNGQRRTEVIGVVGNIRGAGGQAGGGGSSSEPATAVYLSCGQFPQRAMTILVRAPAEPSAIVPLIAAAAREIDPAQPLYQAGRLQDWIDESAAQPRFTTMLSAAFALVALLLAAVGVYGVLSYSVSQRTQEIGVRMAIGAGRGRILRLVLRGGMTWALGGIVIGLAAAFGLARVLATLLFQIEARDPATFTLAGVLLAIVAALACYVPAARATRIDPVIALRAD
jgi:putative ABC transport system permease protein